MNNTTERIIYLWFKKKLDKREIAYVLQVTIDQVDEAVSNELRTHEEKPNWRDEAPPLTPILGRAV